MWFYPLEHSSRFIYQTFWKDGKHYHLLNLTQTESHSFRISAPTLPQNPQWIFSVVGAGWGGDSIHITNRGRDDWGCERRARSSAWLHPNAQSTREEHTPSPPLFQKNPSTLSFLLTPLCPSIALSFSISPAPHLFICPAGCATKTPGSWFQMILKPPHALFCSFSHSPETKFSSKNENEKKDRGGEKDGTGVRERD